jgi:hypothetical protein
LSVCIWYNLLKILFFEYYAGKYFSGGFDEKLQKGTFYGEFDGRRKKRVLVKIIGE